MILKILLGEDDPKALLDELVFLILLDQIDLFVFEDTWGLWGGLQYVIYHDFSLILHGRFSYILLKEEIIAWHCYSAIEWLKKSSIFVFSQKS